MKPAQIVFSSLVEMRETVQFIVQAVAAVGNERGTITAETEISFLMTKRGGIFSKH